MSCQRKNSPVAIIVSPATSISLTAARSATPAALAASAIGKAVGGQAATESQFGPHLKDIALCADGTLALLNAMNWGDNLYALEPRTVRSSGGGGPAIISPTARRRPPTEWPCKAYAHTA